MSRRPRPNVAAALGAAIHAVAATCVIRSEPD